MAKRSTAERKWVNFGARAARINLPLKDALSVDESVNALIRKGYEREIARKPKERPALASLGFHAGVM